MLLFNSFRTLVTELTVFETHFIANMMHACRHTANWQAEALDRPKASVSNAAKSRCLNSIPILIRALRCMAGSHPRPSQTVPLVRGDGPTSVVPNSTFSPVSQKVFVACFQTLRAVMLFTCFLCKVVPNRIVHRGSQSTQNQKLHNFSVFGVSE